MLDEASPRLIALLPITMTDSRASGAHGKLTSIASTLMHLFWRTAFFLYGSVNTLLSLDKDLVIMKGKVLTRLSFTKVRCGTASKT